MSDSHQLELRDHLLAVTLPYIVDKRVTLYEGAAAVMGACAVIIGAMHENARASAAMLVTEALLDHANKRAGEIRRGDLDNHFGN